MQPQAAARHPRAVALLLFRRHYRVCTTGAIATKSSGALTADYRLRFNFLGNFAM
jgi:hypothetical protein